MFPGGTCSLDHAKHAWMSAHGTTRTFRNVRYLVAVGCKGDIEQAAYVRNTGQISTALICRKQVCGAWWMASPLIFTSAPGGTCKYKGITR